MIFQPKIFGTANSHNLPRCFTWNIPKIWMCEIDPVLTDRVRQIAPDQKVGLQCDDPLPTERAYKNDMSDFHCYIGIQIMWFKNFIVQM